MWRFHSSSRSDIGIQLEVFDALTETELYIPLLNDIAAGFPSPAGDFIDQGIDLNKDLIRRPSATFYCRVKGNSMIDAGINDGDLLIIDRSVPPFSGAIALCSLDGEHTIKRLKIEKDCCWLMPENEAYEPIQVTRENEFAVFGVVVHCIKSF